MTTASLIEERALELGFGAVATVPVGPVRDADRLDAWLSDGFAGSMEYMHRHRAIRGDTSALEPGMRTVIAVTAPYDSGPVDPPTWSGYAVRPDYHDVVRDRLRSLADFVATEVPGTRARPAVDSAPVLERSVAVEAGIGWLGKSAMVLRQDAGSSFFLAELLVSAEVELTRPAHPDRCGRCTRCVDLCPTGAIVGPYRVDARRCISYLTIENRGPIPRALRPLVGLHLFGCDICQAVCPWNRRGSTAVLPGLGRQAEVAALNASQVLGLDDAAFAATFRGTPIKRAKRTGLARNAAVVLGNASDTSAVDLLADRLDADPSALVRGHVAWALGRLGGARARSALERAIGREPDSFAREEIEVALAGGEA